MRRLPWRFLHLSCWGGGGSSWRSPKQETKTHSGAVNTPKALVFNFLPLYTTCLIRIFTLLEQHAVSQAFMPFASMPKNAAVVSAFFVPFFQDTAKECLMFLQQDTFSVSVPQAQLSDSIFYLFKLGCSPCTNSPK